MTVIQLVNNVVDSIENEGIYRYFFGFDFCLFVSSFRGMSVSLWKVCFCGTLSELTVTKRKCKIRVVLSEVMGSGL